MYRRPILAIIRFKTKITICIHFTKK